jgi:hypothetical protein
MIIYVSSVNVPINDVANKFEKSFELLLKEYLKALYNK